MISDMVLTPSDVTLSGDLVVPASARAVVLFAHGSGSSRHSPRNRMVAAELRTAGPGTLLVDLRDAAGAPHDRADGTGTVAGGDVSGRPRLRRTARSAATEEAR